jgi:hypothetical protein
LFTAAYKAPDFAERRSFFLAHGRYYRAPFRSKVRRFYMFRFVSPLLVLLSGIMLLGAQQSGPPASAAPTSPQGGTPQGPPPNAKRPNIPDNYSNLKVLPPDIKKQDLMAIMKGFCIERKIRCSQCHAVSDDLTEGDFASDEKPTKIAARDFLKTLFETRAKYPNEGKLLPATK